MKTIDVETRRKALADFLEVSLDSVQEGYTENEFEVDETETYLVLTEDEAYEEAKQRIESLTDDIGVMSFGDEFKDYIFRNCVNSSYEDEVVEDLINSEVDEMEDEEVEDYAREYFGAEYDEESEDQGSKEDWLDDMKEEIKDNMFSEIDDKQEYIRDIFGDEWFDEQWEQDTDYFDKEQIIEEVISWDGVASSLATYDGNELELEDGLYAYRTN